jgi:hypothetical protein
VKHEREIAEVGNAGWVKGSISVDVSVWFVSILASCSNDVFNILGGKLLGSEVAVLSTQVADLARLGLAGIANRYLATLVRILVSASSGAVAVRGDSLLVDVVHEWAAGSGETREGDAELDTSTIGS